MPANREKNYLNILLTPLAECAQYKPAFGKAESDGIDLKQFKSIYGKDPLYHWVGLDSELRISKKNLTPSQGVTK